MYEVCHFDLVISVSPFEVFFPEEIVQKSKTRVHTGISYLIIYSSQKTSYKAVRQWGIICWIMLQQQGIFGMYPFVLLGRYIITEKYLLS